LKGHFPFLATSSSQDCVTTNQAAVCSLLHSSAIAKVVKLSKADIDVDRNMIFFISYVL
jgi:hypothetical protein